MLLVYCDGGTRKGRGAWSYIIVRAPLSSVATDYMGKLSGPILAHGQGVHPQALHSSHMELIAAYEGIKYALKLPKEPITVVSDSNYVTSGLAKAHARALSAESSDKDYSEIVKMWRELIPLHTFHEIGTMHVKGHKKQTGNTFCDHICGEVLTKGDRHIGHLVTLFNNSKSWRASLVKTRR